MRDVIENFNEFKSIRLDINKNRKLFITLRVCQGSIGKNVTLYNRSFFHFNQFYTKLAQLYSILQSY